MTTADQRRELGRLMDLLVQYEPKVHYAQVRPMRTRTIKTERELVARLKTPDGITLDCSESVTLLARLAGLRDPNRLAYDGRGYTGTLLEDPLLTHYRKPENALVGALVVFGPGTGEHVCMVRRAGVDPLLFSHGQERGPVFIRLSEERRYHDKPVTFLSIAKLG